MTPPFEVITEMKHEEKTEENSVNSVESASKDDSENKNIDKDTTNNNNDTQNKKTDEME